MLNQTFFIQVQGSFKLQVLVRIRLIPHIGYKVINYCICCTLFVSWCLRLNIILYYKIIPPLSFPQLASVIVFTVTRMQGLHSFLLDIQAKRCISEPHFLDSLEAFQPVTLLLFQRAGSFDFIGNTDKDRCPITEWVQ